MEPAVEVRNLSKRYRRGAIGAATLREDVQRLVNRARGRHAPPRQEFYALEDVSFSVEPGTVCGIIGRNGSGKTTLLKILSSITAPDEGRAILRGRIGSLLEVGAGFHPELNGMDNIYLNGAILGMTKGEIRRKCEQIIDFADIGPVLSTPVKHYSSGMYVRLAFSIAAHLGPDILILDEVLAVGDAAFQKRCIDRIHELVGEGRTVLLVSHQISIVRKLCSRAILLAAGRVRFDGDTAEVVSKYLSEVEAWSEQNPASRESRSGPGKVRIDKIEVLTDGTYAPSVLVSGRPAQFIFHVSNCPHRADCSFTIYDDIGEVVTFFDTANASEADETSSAGTGIFCCHIDALPLRPGRYRINVAVSSPLGLIEDHLEGAAMFDVVPGALFGRPVNPEAGYGRIMVAHKWSLPRGHAAQGR